MVKIKECTSQLSEASGYLGCLQGHTRDKNWKSAEEELEIAKKAVDDLRVYGCTTREQNEVLEHELATMEENLHKKKSSIVDKESDEIRKDLADYMWRTYWKKR